MEKNSIALITAKCILQVFLLSHIKLMIVRKEETREDIGVTEMWVPPVFPHRNRTKL